MIETAPDHMPYEGAGFLLRFEGNIILGLRRKKPSDFSKDPTPELEYMGGKIEHGDKNDPLLTAYNELVEELGAIVLDTNWRERVSPLCIYQPFTQMWIWCCLIDLNATEFARVTTAANGLETDKWDRDQPYASWTGRATVPVRRSLEAVFLCPVESITAFISGFKTVPASKNRLTDAKTYRNQAKLQCTNIVTGVKAEYPLRAFNTVIWENHMERITQ